MATFGANTNEPFDISVRLMDHLWSPQWWELGVDLSITNIGSQYTIYKVLEYFNIFVLAGVVGIMLWTTFVGVTGTAHEGVPLGRRFSTIWVPIRAAVGVSFLAPIFCGLSILQIIIFQLVVYSIDYANLVNQEVLNNFFNTTETSFSSNLTQGSVPGLNQNANEVSNTVFKALVIQYYYTTVDSTTLQNGNVAYVPIFTDSNKVTEYQFSAPNKNFLMNFMSGSVMASVTVTCDDDLSASCQGKNIATQVLIAALAPVARDLVNLANPVVTSGPNLAAIQAAYVNAHTTYYTSMANTILSSLNPTSTIATESATFLTNAQRKGWLALGSYYWVLSNATQRVLAEAGNMPRPESADLNILERFAVSGGNLDDYLKKATLITQTTQPQQEDMVTFGPKNSFISELFSWPADQTMEYFLQKMSGVDPANPAAARNKDVILNMQEIGHQIVFAGNAVISGIFFNDTLKIKLVEWTNAATGGSLTGGTNSGEQLPTVMLMMIKLLLLALVVLFMVYPLGIALAFYLPAIPLLIWILAGLQWVISTITIMVGAPLWAAAHSLPDGEGLAGNHGREGYILVLNVLLRPTLMVVGFMIAFILIRILGTYLFEIFSIATSAMNAYHSRGFVTIFATIFLFGMIIIIAAQKIFSLIVYFPDIVLSFIGKHIPGGGEGADEQKINAMFERFKGTGAGGLSTVTGKGMIR